MPGNITQFDPALLKLLQLCSPALPVGGFAYSRGLEWAVEAGLVHDEASAFTWIAGLTHESLARLDLPLLLKLGQAFAAENLKQAKYLSALLYAHRETSEARLEERQTGQALAKLLLELGFAQAKDWVREPRATFAACFALAGLVFGLRPEQIALGYAFVWCESQIAAALKLVPLGQNAGQRTLFKLLTDVESAVCESFAKGNAEPGGLVAGQALACGLHESMRTRLFRS